MAKSAGAQFVEDNFTAAQRNQLTLLGVINATGELNVQADTKPNVVLKKVADVEVAEGKKYAVLGHIYIDGDSQRFTANLRKMPDGSVTASTRATFDGGWRETTPQFTNPGTRTAWGQLVRVLGPYCEAIGLV